MEPVADARRHMSEVLHKNFDSPDEEVRPGRGRIAMVHTGEAIVRRIIFEPGWR
jgi:hypothetical protein